MAIMSQSPAPDQLPTAPLTDRELLFASHYLASLNAPRAAIAAGWDPRIAGSEAWRWVTDPSARPALYQHIRDQMDERASRLSITADTIAQELARLGHANVADYMTPEQRQAVAHIPYAKLAALQEIEFEETQPGTDPKKGENTPIALETDALAPRVRIKRIKLHPKTAALMALSAHTGLGFRDQPPIAPPAADDSKRAIIVNQVVNILDSRAAEIATRRLTERSAPTLDVVPTRPKP